MTVNFVPPARRPLPAPVTADIVVEAPPGLPPPGSLLRMLPIVMSVATSAMMAATFFSGSAVTRNPTFLMLPLMMLASAALTVMTGRGRRGGGVDADRADYLQYLGRLRATVTEIALAQRAALESSHPDPDSLWTLIGGPRMWETRVADPDFCLVRVGVGAGPLAARLVAPEEGYASDPVTATAVRRFVDTHSTVTDVPIVIGVRGCHTVTINGDVTAVRGLLRAMICRLAVLHAPDQLLIAGAVSDGNLVHWDWLKWLPHNQHPHRVDALGAARMVYGDAAQALAALAAADAPYAVLIADLDGPSNLDEPANLTLLEVGAGRDGTPVTIDRGGDAQTLVRPDRLHLVDTLVCARRLAGYRADAA
ncbi:MAG: type VII secretion protein EccC, partial [Mycobacterium sp.]|nr:type VII secretion protein EccC [Mycobacterium sp.]